MNPARRAWNWFFSQAYLLALTTMTFWAANFVIGRGVRADVPPVTLAFLRWGGAFLVLAPFAWPYLKRDWPVLVRHWRITLALSILGIATFNTMAYIGLQYTTALNGMLFQSSAPIMIAIFAFAIHAERLRPLQAVGIAVSLSGVVYVTAQGDFDRLASLSFNQGDLWLLVAFICWGIYTALLREKPQVHWLSFLTATFLLGVLALVPFFLWELASGRTLDWTWGAAGAIFYVMLFPSVIAYMCYNRAIELVGGNAIGPLFHAIPIIGSVLAMIFLGERLAAYHLIGFAIIMAGIVLASRKQAKSEAAPPA